MSCMSMSTSSKPLGQEVRWDLPGRILIWTRKNINAAVKTASRTRRYLGIFILIKRTSILSPSFEPLQGIERLGLVADLEIEALAAEGPRVADQGDGLVGPDHL